MKNKRQFLFRLGTIVLLLAICAVMMVVGRGHTVYFDNKSLEYEGTTYEAPYKVVVLVDDEQVAKLYDKERGSSICIGQNFEMTLEITQEKGGDETTTVHQLKLPYDVDGVIINLPGYLAGLPEEAYLSEFVPTVEEYDESAEEIPSGDEFTLGDI